MWGDFFICFLIDFFLSASVGEDHQLLGCTLHTVTLDPFIRFKRDSSKNLLEA